MEKRAYYKAFARYSVLSVLGTVGVSCYILADTFFIARSLGAGGLAALNIAIPAYNVIYGMGLMLGMGGATKFSICKGQGDEARGGTVYRNILVLGAVAALVFVLAGTFFPGKLAALLGADAEILQPTTTYLRWLLLFAPAFLFNNILLCFVRNDGAPQLVAAAMLAGNFANIVLDYILIFPCGMGILGAVLATGASPVISMLLLSLHWKSGKSSLGFGRVRLSAALMLQSLSLGLPSLLAQLSSGVTMVVFNLLILRLAGNVGVAAYGIIANIALVVTAVYTGLSQGVQPLVSDCCGRGQREGVAVYLRYSMAAMAAVSVVVYLLLSGFAPQVTAAFNSGQDAQLQAAAVTGLRLYFTSNLFVGFNTILTVFFTSTGRALPAHFLSLLRGLVLIVPAAVLLSACWGMTGVWLAYPVAEAVAAVLGVAAWRRVSKIK